MENNNGLNYKIDKIVEDVNDLKITSAKLEINHQKTNEILERITDSVEYHIKRSDKLEELVGLIKTEHNNLILSQEFNKKELENKIENKKNNDKLIWVVLAAVGAIILGLNELGILSKLF